MKKSTGNLLKKQFICTILFFLTLSAFSQISKKEKYLNNIREKSIFTFTSGIKDALPIDLLKNFCISELDRIYIHTSFRGLNNKNQKYSCEIYDGGNNHTITIDNKFKGANGFYWSWSSLAIDKVNAVPGNWTFIIYLNKKMISKKTIEVYE